MFAFVREISFLTSLGLVLATAAWFISARLPGHEATRPGSGTEEQGTRLAIGVRRSLAVLTPEERVLRGHAEANRVLDMQFRTSGKVMSLEVSKGQYVAAGDVLVRLDPEDLPARLGKGESAVELAAARYEALRRLGRSGYEARLSVQEAGTQLAAARADLAQIRTAMDYLVLTAPFGGYVEELPVETGEFVSPGSPALSLAELDPILFVTFANEHDVLRLSPDTPVRVITGEGGEQESVRSFDARVVFISRMAVPGTRTFRVEFSARNPDGDIRAGNSARIIATVDRVMAHPVESSLLGLDQQGRLSVRTITDGVVASHAVRIIGSRDDGTSLVAGLPDDVLLIEAGQGYVEPGDRPGIVIRNDPSGGAS